MASTAWKGFLTFGLVSIPVRLYPAARSKSIHFNRLYRPRASEPEQPDLLDASRSSHERNKVVPISGGFPEETSTPSIGTTELSRVTQEFRPRGEENRISREDLVRGYEYAPDRYVVIDKNEIEALTPKTSTTMDLQRFVKLSEVDPIFFERSYYVAPESGSEKPHALLLQAMQHTGFCGLASVAMHRRQHVVVLRPHEQQLLAHTMYYLDEIRQSPPLSIGSSSISEKELRLAEAFINALAGPFQPELFGDEYRSGLQSLIAGKVSAGEALSPRVKPTTRTVDIMEALKASLEQVQKAKQPPQRVTSKPSKARKRGPRT